MSRVAVVLAVTLLLSVVAGSSGLAVAQSGETVTMTVTIRDRTGDPVADADLDVSWDGGSTSATTAGNGKAFVDVPDGAEVEISVTHDRYVRTDPYVIASASERDVEITVYRKSSVRLEVSGPDGALADASVLVERGGLDVATGTTGANGVFESGVIQAGEYTITVTKPGYYSRTKPLSVEGDVTNRVALRPGSVNVTVSVVDPHFDPAAPVNGATVALDGVGTARSAGSGDVTISAPVNTPTTLRVTKSAYRTVTRDLQIGERDVSLTADLSRTPDLTIEVIGQRMVAGERLLVTATDAYGDPASGAAVTLDGDDVGTTDADGELAVTVEEPGTHTLRATREGTTSNEVEIEAIVAGGDETATPTATPTTESSASPTDTGVSAPGFTFVSVALAFLGAALLLLRNR